MATTKELKEKYKDRINPSKKDIEAGVQPLTPLQCQCIEQGIDPEDVAPSAGGTTRDGVTQDAELGVVKTEEPKEEPKKRVSAGEVRKEAAVKASKEEFPEKKEEKGKGK
jgi:hypothetical protein